MPVRREAESEMSLASRELERYQAMTERERLEFNMERAKDPAVSQGGPSSTVSSQLVVEGDVVRDRPGLSRVFHLLSTHGAQH